MPVCTLAVLLYASMPFDNLIEDLDHLALRITHKHDNYLLTFGNVVKTKKVNWIQN